MQRYLEYSRAAVEEIGELIKEFVECESPSDSPVLVNRFVDLLIAKTEDIAKAQRFNGDGAGDHVLLEFDGPAEGKRILCLGHSDTVWPSGTLRDMPFRKEGGRLWGPGVLDMKGGLAFLIYAIRAIRELGETCANRVALLVVSDEEIGSPGSRALTEAEASRSDCVLVLEPGTGLEGKLKTARKGVGRYAVRVRGRASHAGVDFESGANAIVELARQIRVIAAFTDLSGGLTVNPGVISGGTRSNVVPASAEVEVDVRVRSMAQAEAIDRAMQGLCVFDGRCSIEVAGGMNRPPMERTEKIGALSEKARCLAKEMGVDLQESATGGGSDGNFTAAMGIPTLDGLGAVGEGAHAVNESILIDRIGDRVALLCGILMSI
jgi:glutamate carboxypeptidase